MIASALASLNTRPVSASRTIDSLTGAGANPTVPSRRWCRTCCAASGSTRPEPTAGDADRNDGNDDIRRTGTAPAGPVALLLHDFHCNPQFPQVARNQRLRATIADDSRKNQRNRPLFAEFALANSLSASDWSRRRWSRRAGQRAAAASASSGFRPTFCAMHNFCCEDGRIQATKRSCIATGAMLCGQRGARRWKAEADAPRAWRRRRKLRLRRATPEAPDPVRVDKPVEESSAPPELTVQRISPPEPVAAARHRTAAALPAVAIGRDIFDVIAESRAALARGVEFDERRDREFCPAQHRHDGALRDPDARGKDLGRRARGQHQLCPHQFRPLARQHSQSLRNSASSSPSNRQSHSSPNWGKSGAEPGPAGDSPARPASATKTGFPTAPDRETAPGAGTPLFTYLRGRSETIGNGATPAGGPLVIRPGRASRSRQSCRRALSHTRRRGRGRQARSPAPPHPGTAAERSARCAGRSRSRRSAAPR